MKQFVLFFSILSCWVSLFAIAPESEETSIAISRKLDPPFYSTQTKWADSVFNTLTLKQKIGQLFMVAAFSNKDQVHVDQILRYIREYGIGGVIFFQGGPIREARLTNLYQSKSNVPLLIGIDGEWGLGMRLDSTVSFPRQMAIAATGDKGFMYELGRDIAIQCKRMGIHVNFAPVVDVNSNPHNPVIHTRSFGEDPEEVTEFALAYMRGLQDNGILAAAKHFPGHGNTDADSHFTLPTVMSGKNEMQKTELYPFQKLIQAGVAGVMVAHLSVPSLDTANKLPSSLSRLVIDSLLVGELGFKGLIFTDAMNMKGVSELFKPGEAEIKAILAGNDILLYPQDVDVAVRAVENAVFTGEIPMELIDKKVYKILLAKQWAGLDSLTQVNTERLLEDLNTPYSGVLKKRIVENSITLLRNESSLIPLGNLNQNRIASVAFGVKEVNGFQKQLQFFSDVDVYVLPYQFEMEYFDSLLNVLHAYHTLIFSFHGLNNKPAEAFGLSAQSIMLADSVSHWRQCVLCFFGNPYPVKYFTDNKDYKTMLLAYDDGPYTREAMAQAIFGAIPLQARIPVSFNGIDLNTGEKLEEQRRLKYSFPEELGIEAGSFYRVDSIVNDAIKRRAMPGCQVLFACKGKVIYHKAFGFHTYDSLNPVQWSDLYDIASLTKIAATTPAVMKLMEEGKIDLNKSIGEYLPELRRTNKYKLKIKDILMHQAGFKAWIPFYQKTLRAGVPDTTIYSKYFKPGFTVRVCDSLYILTSYRDSILQTIYTSEIQKGNKYLYSDLGFYLLRNLVERVSGMDINDYVYGNFYLPLGAASLGYLPLNRFDVSRIVPSVVDSTFRKTELRGYVHDPGAAMLGGVAGHAGLFSNANGLAKFMQMLLWEGSYGGVRYFEPSTIRYFTKAHALEKNNRRGLGFDKPEPDATKVSPVCPGISLQSYGHTGFTGTMAWVDPETESVYIFLSNRTFPDESNTKLVELNARTKIQQVFLDAVKNIKKAE